MLNLTAINPLAISSKELFILMNGLSHYMRTINGINANAIDFVGTGGDGKNSVNFSTMASFIIAASGVTVAKHGSRAVSSKSGSFDCLDVLTIDYPKTAEQALAQQRQYNLTFLCAPYFNQIFDEVGQLRKSLGLKKKLTVFNLLGPLLNPSLVQRRVIGVYDQALIKPMIETLQLMKIKKAIVVHGQGFDEFTTTGTNHYALLEHGQISYHQLNPKDFNLTLASETELIGGDATYNAKIMKKVLRGNFNSAITDMTLLNAAAGIFVGRDDIDFQQAFIAAKQTLTSGKAHTLLTRMRAQDRILDVIVANKKLQLDSLPEPETVTYCERSFLDALSNYQLNIIAEIKMHSPSAGQLNQNRTAAEIALSYQQAGASAISVLTDEKYFSGSFEHLKQVSEASRLPILCKDIIIDQKQIKLARHSGAHACLLIVAALSQEQLIKLKSFTESLGMTAIIEVHSEEELNRALVINPKIILINNRNLQTLMIDPERAIHLARKIPSNIKIISASGISQAKEVKRLPRNINAVLIGTKLMQTENPKKFIQECLA